MRHLDIYFIEILPVLLTEYNNILRVEQTLSVSEVCRVWSVVITEKCDYLHMTGITSLTGDKKNDGEKLPVCVARQTWRPSNAQLTIGQNIHKLNFYW